jgi:VanZ family protein
MRSRIWLILWIVGILFPMAFLARLSPAFGNVFNAAFSSDWTHILMHTLLYAVLGFLLAQWIAPASRPAVLILLGLGLLVGCLHESLQLLTAGVWPGWPPEILDLSVDLMGTTLGIGLAGLLAHAKRAAQRK